MNQEMRTGKFWNTFYKKTVKKKTPTLVICLAYIQTMLIGLYPNNAYRLISKQCLQAYIQTMLIGLYPNNAYRLISKQCL